MIQFSDVVEPKVTKKYRLAKEMGITGHIPTLGCRGIAGLPQIN